MELWIRSQDKRRLLNVKGFILEESTPWGNKSGILSDSKFLLGLYETKERATEVIDEIQKALDDSDFFVFNNCKIDDGTILKDLMKEPHAAVCGNGASIERLNKNVIIYTMPEE